MNILHYFGLLLLSLKLMVWTMELKAAVALVFRVGVSCAMNKGASGAMLNVRCNGLVREAAAADFTA